MNFVKRNKGTIIAIVIFLVILVFFVQVFNMFMSNDEKALYGNRLDGKEAVSISSDNIKKIKQALKDETKKCEVEEQGRILNVIITVNDDANLDSAKNLASKVLEQLKDKQKKYYDIQVFIKKSIETNDFPIIGYKHHTKDNYTWTKDR